MTIALDANGSDRGPGVVADGARASAVRALVFGPQSDLGADLAVVDAPDSITNDEPPIEALRRRPDASVAQAARAVGEGRAGALVSAGSTGAVLAASLRHIGCLPGVDRAALAVLLPAAGRPTLLLDVGAGVRARPAHLVEFAHMGAAFMATVHGIARPSVALLSVGREAGKGTPDVISAAGLLAGGPLDFAGNVEGGDLLAGDVDVVVCDGFAGNIALKAMEGAARGVAGGLRHALRSGPGAALGGLFARGALRSLRARFDPDAHGGAILLGMRRPVVVAHGASSRAGIAAALTLARRAVDERMVELTAAALEREWSRSPSASVGNFASASSRESRIPS